jgi:hypothetical protein
MISGTMMPPDQPVHCPTGGLVLNPGVPGLQARKRKERAVVTP